MTPGTEAGSPPRLWWVGPRSLGTARLQGLSWAARPGWQRGLSARLSVEACRGPTGTATARLRCTDCSVLTYSATAVPAGQGTPSPVLLGCPPRPPAPSFCPCLSLEHLRKSVTKRVLFGVWLCHSAGQLGDPVVHRSAAEWDHCTEGVGPGVGGGPGAHSAWLSRPCTCPTPSPRVPPAPISAANTEGGLPCARHRVNRPVPGRPGCWRRTHRAPAGGHATREHLGKTLENAQRLMCSVSCHVRRIPAPRAAEKQGDLQSQHVFNFCKGDKVKE